MNKVDMIFCCGTFDTVKWWQFTYFTFAHCQLKEDYITKVWCMMFLFQHPLNQVETLASGNKDTRDRRILIWYFEHKLKELYATFVEAIKVSHWLFINVFIVWHTITCCPCILILIHFYGSRKECKSFKSI